MGSKRDGHGENKRRRETSITLAGGVLCENETVNLYDKAQKVMKDRGFSLRKWNCSLQSFREEIKQDSRSAMEASSKESEITQNLNKEESSNAKDGKLETEKLVKILGIYWDAIQDEFCYDLSELIYYADALPASKRSVLKL